MSSGRGNGHGGAGPRSTARWRPVPLFRRATRAWRRSLRLRVVALTLLLSSIVMALLGVLLLNRVGHGLLADKRKAALGDVSSGLTYARSQLDSAARVDPELGRRAGRDGDDRAR